MIKRAFLVMALKAEAVLQDMDKEDSKGERVSELLLGAASRIKELELQVAACRKRHAPARRKR